MLGLANRIHELIEKKKSYAALRALDGSSMQNTVLIKNDLILLNQKMIKFIFISELKNVIIIVKLNAFQYHINHFQMKYFA